MSAIEEFHLTDGLVAGEVIQFADGRWPGVVGAGIAMTEESFDLVEPQIPNYTISKIGVTVVRPGLIPGTIVVDKLTPQGFDASSMPNEAYRALAGNALNRYNAKNNPTAPKVNPC